MKIVVAFHCLVDDQKAEQDNDEIEEDLLEEMHLRMLDVLHEKQAVAFAVEENFFTDLGSPEDPAITGDYAGVSFLFVDSIVFVDPETRSELA